MNTRTSDIQNSNVSTSYSETIIEDDATYYPVEIEDEMGETAFHFKIISLFYGLLDSYFSTRNNVTVAANMMVYYEKGDTKRWLAPDIFVCFGVENHLRRVFKVWEEGVFPQVVFEIASENTFENDLGGKRIDYARLGVEEYYLIDPEREYLPSPLMAFHRQKGRLLSANVENKRILSPLLNLEIVETEKSFRLFNPQTKEFLQTILTGEE
jgi:Uma2 family endonuclease